MRGSQELADAISRLVDYYENGHLVDLPLSKAQFINAIIQQTEIYIYGILSDQMKDKAQSIPDPTYNDDNVEFVICPKCAAECATEKQYRIHYKGVHL